MKEKRKIIKGPDKEKIVIQLRTLLLNQEEILKKYLAFAEKEKATIISGDTVTLYQCRALENEFIRKTEAYGKVIPPFDTLYSETVQNKDPEIENLKANIRRIQSKLLILNKENREALQIKMGLIKKELEKLLKKKKGKPSPYRKIGNPSYIDTSA